jgi:hypothetical protein
MPVSQLPALFHSSYTGLHDKKHKSNMPDSTGQAAISMLLCTHSRRASKKYVSFYRSPFFIVISTKGRDLTVLFVQHKD